MPLVRAQAHTSPVDGAGASAARLELGRVGADAGGAARSPIAQVRPAANQTGTTRQSDQELTHVHRRNTAGQPLANPAPPAGPRIASP
jgi:hypothetical protein